MHPLAWLRPRGGTEAGSMRGRAEGVLAPVGSMRPLRVATEGRGTKAAAQCWLCLAAAGMPVGMVTAEELHGTRLLTRRSAAAAHWLPLWCTWRTGAPPARCAAHRSPIAVCAPCAPATTAPCLPACLQPNAEPDHCQPGDTAQPWQPLGAQAPTAGFALQCHACHCQGTGPQARRTALAGPTTDTPPPCAATHH